MCESTTFAEVSDIKSLLYEASISTATVIFVLTTTPPSRTSKHADIYVTALAIQLQSVQDF